MLGVYFNLSCANYAMLIICVELRRRYSVLTVKFNNFNFIRINVDDTIVER